MARWGTLSLFVVAVLGASLTARPERPDIIASIPPEVEGWRAEGKPQTYDRKSVYDYLDGGAEVYLAYGMKSLWASTYAKPDETPITLNLFEMESAAGAYGAFTFEREDEQAAIGQGSEYGAGMLRFWQGPYFVFVQAEKESPASRRAVLSLGKTLASRLGPALPCPSLPKALPQDGLRALSIRYVLSPQLLESVERTGTGNPLGLPLPCEAVVARYGMPGNPERVLVARLPNSKAAAESVGKFLKGTPTKPGEAFKSEGGWSIAESAGAFAVLVLDAPSGDAALKRLAETRNKTKGMPP